MRGWLVLASVLWAGAAEAMPPQTSHLPLASRFDLTRLAVRPTMDIGHHEIATRWLTADLTPPPGPPRDPAMVKFRGKKVKFRMSF